MTEVTEVRRMAAQRFLKNVGAKREDYLQGTSLLESERLGAQKAF